MISFCLNLREEVQLTSASVDLLTGIILIPLLFIFYKLQTNNEMLKKKWIYFFACLSIGNIMGFFFHFFEISELAGDILWIPLYFIMFEIAKMFFKIGLDYINKSLNKKYEMIFDIVTEIICIVATIVSFFTVNEIRIFVVYAALIDLPAFIMFIYLAIKKKNKCGRIMILALLPQIFGLYFQLTKSGGFKLIYAFNHDGIYHICLLLSVVIFFFASYFDLKDTNIERK